MFFNGCGVAIAYFMLALSIWLAPVDLSTKGYWGLGILLLTLALVNFVKYRFDAKISEDRLARLEDAKNEKLMAEYIGKSKGTRVFTPQNGSAQAGPFSL